jgi:hypothetical protein
MFWIKVEVQETGKVIATTFNLNVNGDPRAAIRARSGATVSQALRNLAAAMVQAKAETVGQKPAVKEFKTA